MPGIPKSKACMACKKRKIKCDQRWPTCSPCYKSGLVCAGPTEVLKFVYNGRHTNQKHAAQVQDEKFQAPPPNPEALSLQVRKTRATGGGDGARFTSYRLVNSTPKEYPTTLSERVSHQLVGHLERGHDGGLTLQMSYIKHLPQRLEQSACLRDAVALFSAKWTSFRRRQPGDEVRTMTLHGKALRSLQRAIQGKEALQAETLASIAILERVEALFNRKPTQVWTTHAEGIKNLMMKKGPPNVDDKLDVLVAQETHGLLIGLRSISGGQDFMQEAPWKEAMEKCETLYWAREELGPVPVEFFLLIDRTYHDWPNWIAQSQDIYDNPHSEEIMGLAEDLGSRLRCIEAKMSPLILQHTDEAIRQGYITIEEDPGFFAGRKYGFKHPALAQVFMSWLMLRQILLFMPLQLDMLYGRQDAARFAEYRDVGVQTWMMIPYLRSLEPIVASSFLGAIHLSWDAATDDEQDELVDSVVDLDSIMASSEMDRPRLAWFMKENAKLMTGRRRR